MESVTYIFDFVDSLWMALYVSVIVITNITTLRTSMKGTQESLLSMAILISLNIIAPIGLAISTGLWMFAVIGIAFIVMLTIAIIYTARMAVDDAKEE